MLKKELIVFRICCLRNSAVKRFFFLRLYGKIKLIMKTSLKIVGGKSYISLNTSFSTVWACQWYTEEEELI